MLISIGAENLDSGVGVYAPDAESYTLFADLFNPIIEEYHVGFGPSDKHPPKDFGNQYREMEEKVSTTLQGMSGELKGTYYPLTGMDKATQQKLIDDHFLFKEGDRFLQAANACRYWPTGRGIFHNDNKTFLVWANEEDHLRIISMQKGGDLKQVYKRLVDAVNIIESRLPFSHDERLGFLTFCPTNLGTTIRASVHIKVPKLAKNKDQLEAIAARYNLQVRGKC
ncbi:arginine kinase [Nephila pilipes]|uniref:arginine kinase n=1 Tax=Nephila pilipes TaxID=299642 RepID=A0A8X6QBR1_NEPPI|nr:arginine kinase [Nephila pilipes]